MKKDKFDNVTAIIEVISDGGIVTITSLLKGNKNFKIWKDTTYITFYKNYKHNEIYDTWDNQKWVERLGFHLTKSYKKNNKYYKELKRLCKKNDLDFKEIKKQVAECYLKAKKLKMLN